MEKKMALVTISSASDVEKKKTFQINTLQSILIVSHYDISTCVFLFNCSNTAV